MKAELFSWSGTHTARSALQRIDPLCMVASELVYFVRVSFAKKTKGYALGILSTTASSSMWNPG
jgi:hypothetical protein